MELKHIANFKQKLSHDILCQDQLYIFWWGCATQYLMEKQNFRFSIDPIQTEPLYTIEITMHTSSITFPSLNTLTSISITKSFIMYNISHVSIFYLQQRLLKLKSLSISEPDACNYCRLRPYHWNSPVRKKPITIQNMSCRMFPLSKNYINIKARRFFEYCETQERFTRNTLLPHNQQKLGMLTMDSDGTVANHSPYINKVYMAVLSSNVFSALEHIFAVYMKASLQKLPWQFRSSSTWFKHLNLTSWISITKLKEHIGRGYI